ncbi:hypothetical protein [Actinomadura madurae]|uniref:hypothetical protein n=1 Tax=Actinomadura madurae TaxID=1993 RepID=UPI0020D21F08|nr:hypothetical protein [Actinomadura madurae]MCQ0013753.1 hypothetical protein [Actinomadura madurae]
MGRALAHRAAAAIGAGQFDDEIAPIRVTMKDRHGRRVRRARHRAGRPRRPAGQRPRRRGSHRSAGR